LIVGQRANFGDGNFSFGLIPLAPIKKID